MSATDTFTIRAILTAYDKGFTSAMNIANKSTQQLGSGIASTIKAGALMQVGMKATNVVMNTLTGSMDAAISRYDQLNAFPKIMKNLGISTEDSAAAIKEIDKGIKGLPTTLDSATSGVTRFVSKNNDIKKSTKYFLAMNNAIIAGNQPSQIQASAIEQLSQAYAKGRMDMLEWRSVQSAMPAQINQVAKAMGMSTAALGSGLREGTVSMDEFMDTMVKLNETGVDGMASFATQAQDAIGGIDVAMTNLKTSVSRGVANSISALDTMLKKNKMPTIAETFVLARNKIDSAFKVINKGIENLNIKGIVDGLKPTYKALKNFAVGVAKFLKPIAKWANENAESIAKLIPVIIGLKTAYSGFKILGGIVPNMMKFTKSITGLAKKGIGGIAAKLFGISKAQDSVGRSSKVNAQDMVAAGKSMALMGVAVLLIAAGFALLAQSSIALASAGGLAIGVMAGMAVGVAAIGFGMAALLKWLAPMSGQLMPAATAMLAMGAAIVLVAAGFSLLAFSAIKLAEAGTPAIVCMFGMVACIALLAAGAAALGPALTAGAVGFVAFGAAILLVGAGALLASLALQGVASVLPTLCEYGLQGAVAIYALGASMAVFAMGAILAGVGCVALAVGLVAVGAACLVAMAGAMVLGMGIMIAAVGVALLAASLKLVNSQMKSIAKNAKATTNSLKSMVGSVNLVKAGLDAIGSKAKSAMKSLISSFSQAESKAKSSGTKVGNGFTLGFKTSLAQANIAAMAVSVQVATSLRSGYSLAYSAGAYISQGMAKGMTSQLGVIQKAAQQMAVAADKALRAKAKIKSPSRVSVKDGQFWGEGLVVGIKDMFSKVKNVAQDLISLPQLNTPDLAFGYSGAVSAEYDYYRNSEYTIVVPVEIDGREVARTTAPYTQEELNKRETRENRKKGRI